MTTHNKNHMVVQENELILQKGEMSAIEMKLFYAIIKTIDRKARSFSLVKIPVKEIISDWSLNPKHAYGEIKTALHKLASKSIQKEKESKTGKMTYEVIPYLSYAKYEKGFITVEISEQMAPYLLELKQYTKQCYEQLTKIRGEYALRLYELMEMSLKMRLRKYKINELRGLLNIEGKYEDNQNFIRYVIEPALEEINEKTEILVFLAKFGRGDDTTLSFRIEEKAMAMKGENHLSSDHEGTEEEKPKEVKHKYGEYMHVLLTDKQVEQLTKDYGVQMKDACIKYLDEYIEMKGYKARSHYLCIKKWVIDAVTEKKANRTQHKEKGELDPRRRLEFPNAKSD